MKQRGIHVYTVRFLSAFITKDDESSTAIFKRSRLLVKMRLPLVLCYR